MLATTTRSSVDETLLRHYEQVKARTLALAEPLSPEDCLVQSMPDASPTKWHLAHTTWFFDTFVVGIADPDSPAICPAADYLFNSYYNAVGDRIARPNRGLLSRPSLQEILDYRQAVDNRIRNLLLGGVSAESAKRLTLGLHHEQQHQELLLTDIKHALASNPTRPAYLESTRPDHAESRTGESFQPVADSSWRDFDEPNRVPCSSLLDHVRRRILNDAWKNSATNKSNLL